MLEQRENRPVFFYSFQPLMNEYRQWPGDGGFGFALYQNGDAMVTAFGADRREREQKYFHVPAALTNQLERILQNCDSWMGGIPQNIPVPEQYNARFVNCIGVGRYPFITIEDIGAASQLPFGHPVGRAVRHLTCLLEDVSEVLLSMGVSLSIDGIEIDENQAGKVEKVSRQGFGGENMWRGVAGF